MKWYLLLNKVWRILFYFYLYVVDESVDHRNIEIFRLEKTTVSKYLYGTFNFTAVYYNLKELKRKTLWYLDYTSNINVDPPYLKQASWISWSGMSSPSPSIQMMIDTDNPRLSSSINKYLSSRAGLEAQLKMGEEISSLFPPAVPLSAQGCPSQQTPPHLIYLRKGHLQQLQSSQVSGERETCVGKSAGLLLLRNGLHGMAPSVPNQHTGQKSVWGSEQLGELLQTRDCEGCNFLLVSVGDTLLAGSTWLRDLPKVRSWPYLTLPGVKIFSCPSKFIQSWSHSSLAAIGDPLLAPPWSGQKTFLDIQKAELNIILIKGISEGLTKALIMDFKTNKLTNKIHTKSKNPAFKFLKCSSSS